MIGRRRGPWIVALLALLGGVSCLRGDDKSLRAVIDAELVAAWQRQKLAPPAPADEAEFIRRVYLDLVGTIPTHDEAVAFLKDGDAKKRGKLIDRLLADRRFAQQQARVWDLLFFGRSPANPDATRNRDSFVAWLTEKFARNESYDQWVRELLLAEKQGPELFYVQFRNQPEEATEAVTRLFLGTQLQCARCHDHPFERWTQRDFFGMAGFFVRLVVVDQAAGKTRRYAIAEKSTGEVLFAGPVKDRKPGQKGEPVKARFLGGPPLEEPTVPKGFKEPNFTRSKTLPPPLFSRKARLAVWLTAADNPYFARAAVNRVWAQFLGRGLVDPVDDLSSKNPARLPELFETLAREFVNHRFDLKWLIRELTNSRAYQATGRGSNADALPLWYERARVRPLSAEELLDSIVVATGFRPAGGKWNDNTPAYFRMYFGQPTNGRGEFQGGLAEHLFLNNSGQLKGMIQRRKGNLSDQVLSSKEPWEKRVEQMFLSVLSRRPSPQEQAKFVRHLTSQKTADALVEEAVWVLLNTAEFRFNR